MFLTLSTCWGLSKALQVSPYSILQDKSMLCKLTTNAWNPLLEAKADITSVEVAELIVLFWMHHEIGEEATGTSTPAIDVGESICSSGIAVECILGVPHSFPTHHSR